MADQFDRAQELDALAVESFLALHQKNAAKAARLVPTGACLNPVCEEPFEEVARLFCNPACESEHRRRCK
jgi:hypothetical protein